MSESAGKAPEHLFGNKLAPAELNSEERGVRELHTRIDAMQQMFERKFAATEQSTEHAKHLLFSVSEKMQDLLQRLPNILTAPSISPTLSHVETKAQVPALSGDDLAKRLRPESAEGWMNGTRHEGEDENHGTRDQRVVSMYNRTRDKGSESQETAVELHRCLMTSSHSTTQHPPAQGTSLTLLESNSSARETHPKQELDFSRRANRDAPVTATAHKKDIVKKPTLAELKDPPAIPGLREEHNFAGNEMGTTQLSATLSTPTVGPQRILICLALI